MVIPKEKLKKASRIEKVFNVAKYACVALDAAISALFIGIMCSSVIPHGFASICVSAFVGILMFIATIPDIQASAMLKAVGLSRFQTVYIAKVDSSISVEKTEIIGLRPENIDDPVETSVSLRIGGVETRHLYLTYEEAERVLNESINQILNSVKAYIGYTGHLSEEARLNLMECYSGYTASRTLGEIFGLKSETDWLDGFAEYVASVESEIEHNLLSSIEEENEKDRNKRLLRAFVS